MRRRKSGVVVVAVLFLSGMAQASLLSDFIRSVVVDYTERQEIENALNELAWDLVTSKDPSLHDFPRAITLAKHSIALDENGYNLDTLMVAYFDSGQYEKALHSVEYLIEFHRTQNPENPAPEYLIKRLAQYKKAWVESGGSL